MQYMLKNDKVIVRFDTLGGGIVSIQDSEGLEYLWQGDPEYWSGQAPVMFPICGSLRDKKAYVGDGLTCTMERHGLVRKLEFAYAGQTEDTITFSICSNEDLNRRKLLFVRNQYRQPVLLMWITGLRCWTGNPSCR